jgi:MFS family permease
MNVRSRIAGLRERRDEAFQAYKDRSRLVRAFRHRDFRLMWGGAFLSFIGSWVQTVAQGYLVFQLTHSNQLLALVSFCGSVPTTIFGPIAGSLADIVDRKKLLVVTQIIFASGAFYLAAATYFQFVTYWQIITVALILGVVATVEQPVRQSTVSSCVPPEDLPVAIPLNAMTFNISRLIGPAIGGLLLAVTGTASCYFVNGLSFFALIFAALALRADLSPKQRAPQPVRDLITEGALYTFRDRRLRTLFALEAIVSMCGLTYLIQMPAIAEQMLHDKLRGMAIGYVAVGTGTVSALAIIMQLADRSVRALMIRSAMTVLGFALFALSFARTVFAAFPIFALLGMCAVTHFNITNTLFQTLAPPRLRGRVLAMHMWALSGLGPFGTLAFGYIAEHYGLPMSLRIGGAIIVVGAVWAWTNRDGLLGVDDRESFYGVEEP